MPSYNANMPLDPLAGSRQALGTELLKVLTAYGYQRETASEVEASFLRVSYSGYATRVRLALSPSKTTPKVIPQADGSLVYRVSPVWISRSGHSREISKKEGLCDTNKFVVGALVSDCVRDFSKLLVTMHALSANAFSALSPRCSRCGGPTFTTKAGKTGVCADVCWELGPRAPVDLSGNPSYRPHPKLPALPAIKWRSDGSVDFIDEEAIAESRALFKERYLAAAAYTHQPMGLFAARARILYTEKYGKQPSDPHEWLEAANLAYKDVLPFGEDDVEDALDALT
jgi:hypothetical protein